MGTKKCRKCLKTKTVELFNKNKNTKDGFASYCKECLSRLQKEKLIIKKGKNMKRCSKCKELKTFDMFTPDRQSKDGCQSWCKFCKNQQLKESRNKKEIDRRIKERGIDLNGQPIDIELETTKICTKCKKTKKIKDFYYLPSRGRHHNYCIECDKKIKKMRREKQRRNILGGN